MYTDFTILCIKYMRALHISENGNTAGSHEAVIKETEVDEMYT